MNNLFSLCHILKLQSYLAPVILRERLPNGNNLEKKKFQFNIVRRIVLQNGTSTKLSYFSVSFSRSSVYSTLPDVAQIHICLSTGPLYSD